MISAQDLRTGNIIEHPNKGSNGYVYVTHRIISDLASSNSPLDYKPIELTEEWYKRFNLTGKYDSRLKNFNSDGDSFYFGDLPLKLRLYVHQLQNWYFCNKGEELKIITETK